MAKLPSITVLASILILVSMVMIIYWYAFKRGTFFMAEVPVTGECEVLCQTF
jgi:hypothetical protein